MPESRFCLFRQLVQFLKQPFDVREGSGPKFAFALQRCLEELQCLLGSFTLFCDLENVALFVKVLDGAHIGRIGMGFQISPLTQLR